jgi:hypothetical protein
MIKKETIMANTILALVCIIGAIALGMDNHVGLSLAMLLAGSIIASSDDETDNELDDL